LEISWSDQTARKAEQFKANEHRTERAACALALLLVHHLLGESQVDVTEYGERADYRLLDTKHVLEISGTTVAAELRHRHREKTEQALDNPLGWDALVWCAPFLNPATAFAFLFTTLDGDHLSV
jgi:hypothetical protein